MKNTGHYCKSETLQAFGIDEAGTVHWNLTTPERYTEVLKREEGLLVYLGPLAVDMGKYTGRSPNDKFVVRDDTTENKVDCYELPEHGVMPMHCSTNVGPDNEVVVFFGLLGTGKTTLSATSDRTLIDDDEHGWSDEGVFNFEGGCYAKIEHLSARAESEIYETTRRFGTILENVVVDPETDRVNLDDISKTQNTRAAYPITHISNASVVGYAGTPTNIIFLTADAFGVLPPIAKFTEEQYTAKLAGTERGGTEPQSCPGVPAEVLDPRATWQDKEAYDAQATNVADMFSENFKKYEVNVSDAVKRAGPRAREVV